MKATYIEIAQLLVGGGILSYLFKYAKEKLYGRRVDFNLIMDRLLKENEEIKGMVEQYRSEIDFLKNRNLILENKIQLLESAHMTLPVPMWLKGMDGIMLSVNKSFEDTFLTPHGKSSSDYIGHRDEDIWGPDLAMSFHVNDERVKAGEDPLYTVEPVVLNGVSKDYRVIKYLRRVGGVPMGIGGICFPLV